MVEGLLEVGSQAFSFSGIRHVLSFQAMAAVAVICGRNNGLTLGVPSEI